MRISQEVIVPIWIASVAGLMIMVKLLKPSPVDHAPKAAIKIKKSNCLLAGILLIALVAWHAIPEYYHYRSLVAIQQHGDRAFADVDSIYKSHCTKSGCSLSARYHYMVMPIASGAPVSVYGDDDLGRNEYDDPHYVYANATKRVPVAYDRLNPKNSAINFDDQVFKTNQSKHFISRIEIILLPMILVAILMVVTIIAFSGRKGSGIS